MKKDAGGRRAPAVNPGGAGPKARAPDPGSGSPPVWGWCDFTSVGYFALTTTGRIRDVNPQGGRLLGCDPAVLAGRSFLEFTALASRDACQEMFRDAVATGRPRSATLRLNAGHGRFFWAFLECRADPDARDRREIRVAATDVTDRILSEQASARLVSAVEQAGESIVIIQPEGQITYANQAFETINGIPRAAARDRSYFALFPPPAGGADWSRQAVAAISRGTSWTGRVTRSPKDGPSRILLLSLSPIKGPNGQIFNYLVLERDLTREAELEDHLHQIQKFEALGTLAGGIAHDLNNALGPIILNSEMGLLDAGSDSETRDRLQVVLRAAERAKNLVRQILTITSRRKVQKRPVRLSALLKDSLSFIRASLPSTIEIRTSGIDTEGLVLADKGQIEQVLLNLANNAAYVMRETGGVLGVDLARIAVASPAENGLAGLKPGPYLRVTVEDTGPGIDPGIKDRIFDPFFTTKPQGEGTGLGLAVVRGILESHDGQIIAANDPVRGAAFSFFLPETEMEEGQEEETETSLVGGNNRILLVDDEELQVLSWRLALERLGYRVTSATSPEEALGLFAKNPAAFDLMITDQTMPRMTGLALAQEAMRIRPGLPVVLCSGFSEILNAESARQAGIKIFLRKPLGLQEMADAVRAALGETGGRKGRVSG